MTKLQECLPNWTEKPSLYERRYDLDEAPRIWWILKDVDENKGVRQTRTYRCLIVCSSMSATMLMEANSRRVRYAFSSSFGSIGSLSGINVIVVPSGTVDKASRTGELLRRFEVDLLPENTNGSCRGEA